MIILASRSLVVAKEQGQCCEEVVDLTPGLVYFFYRLGEVLVELSEDVGGDLAAPQMARQVREQAVGLSPRALRKRTQQRERACLVDLETQLAGGHILQVMSFVDDQVLIAREDTILGNHVRKQQRMVDHDEMGFVCLPSGPVEEARADA